MNNEFMKNYAKVIVEIGLNLQEGEEVFINSPVTAVDLARAIAEYALSQGASRINYSYSDQKMEKIRFMGETRESVLTFPEWMVKQKDYIPEHKCAYVAILAEDPDAYKEIDPSLLAERSKIIHEKYKKFYDDSMGNGFKWCLAAYSFPEWATKVFPDLPEAEAVEKLWQYIAITMRMDKGDAVENWKKHQDEIIEISNYLNEMQFDYFHYENGLGTDLKVGMPENYVFTGAKEVSADGVSFTANMPTEESFSAPHKDKVEGIVYSTKPLVENGRVIEDFFLRFEKGRVVEFGAKKGEDALRELIETDEGSHYLGEIALVGYSTPISQLKTVFYNTLFDENASCHFALGRAYPTCVLNGEKMSAEEKAKAGINSSLEHCDFMVGSKDLKITAYKNGEAYPIFEGGDFVKEFKR